MHAAISTLSMVDCPEGRLGNLECAPGRRKYNPWLAEEEQLLSPSPEGTHPHVSEGVATVNGVALPERVLNELRRLGISIAWYTQTELEDAVRACHYDGRLIDDPHGVTLRDKMKLTHDEKMAMHGHAPEAAHRKSMYHPPAPATPFEHQGFCKELDEEREKELSERGKHRHHGCSPHYS